MALARTSVTPVLACADGTHVYGDIELHLRPAGWHAHGHASDPRYNGLALHVVLTRGARDPVATSLANGRAVPLVVLGDLGDSELPVASTMLWRWPCFGIATEGGAPSLLTELLHTAGMARFAEAHRRARARIAHGPSVGWQEWGSLGWPESHALAGAG